MKRRSARFGSRRPIAKKPRLVVFSARGAGSFTAAERARLGRACHVRFVRAPQRLTRSRFLHFLSEAHLIGLSPRATPTLDAKLLARLPSLRGVAIPTTGHEWLNTAALSREGIAMTHVPGFSSASTAEFAFTLLLALARGAPARQTPPRPGRELFGKTLGVVGFGNVGRAVARIARGFGMRLLAHDRRPRRAPGVRFVSLDGLLRRSDAVTLHLPLTRETRNLFDRRCLARIKKGSFLINTARPGLLNPSALIASLKSGRIGGVAVDRGYDSPTRWRALARRKNALVVPHVSWYTREAVERERHAWVEGMIALAAGRCLHPIHAIPRRSWAR